VVPLSIDGKDKTVSPTDGGVHIKKLILEPSRAEVLDQLLPRILQTKFRHFCFHAKASEHGSRMTAMDAATKNADELTYKLQLTYNKVRQSGITSELLDILGGAEAIK
jgi:F-type H+-transporting ATPase subunit gamma